jgi:hypothetical protein
MKRCDLTIINTAYQHDHLIHRHYIQVSPSHENESKSVPNLETNGKREEYGIAYVQTRVHPLSLVGHLMLYP